MIIIYAAVVGLIIGSAINAIVWRLYVGRKWTSGRSMCPECKHELAAKDLVPVLSWLALRGKCRYCHARIHWQYPVVELSTAVLFGLSAAALHPTHIASGAAFVVWLVLLTLLIILAVYDLRWMILPDKIMLPAIGVAAVLLVVRALSTHSWLTLRGPAIAAVAIGGAFYALVAVSKGRAMGGGDIKLAFAMGLILGLRGSAIAMLIAFDSAALIAVILLLARRRGRRDRIAFGPFLVAGTVIAYLYGGPIVHWYLHFNGLA